MIRVVNIEKKFGDIFACNSVDLEIQEGEFFFILGPSGCGKTTLLKAISGLIEPDSGSVYLKEQCLDGIPAYKRDINTVFQNYALFPHMTVFENVAFGLKMKKRARTEIGERVTKILGLVELEGFKHRKPDQLSGGQQQRVALARALVNEPSVLLLDEPLAALDVKLRKQMQIELKHMQKRLGFTFIYVTHDQDEALTMADRIAVMNNGQIEQIGTPHEIYNQPKTRFVADFIGENNFIESKGVNIRGDYLLVELDEHQEIKGRPINDIKTGKNIAFTIRPERIQVFNNPPPMKETINLLKGQIEEIVYKGAMLHYYVKISKDLTIKVFDQVDTSNHSFKPKDVVFLVWNVENTIAVENDSPGIAT